jgi:hypothetical protein
MVREPVDIAVPASRLEMSGPIKARTSRSMRFLNNSKPKVGDEHKKARAVAAMVLADEMAEQARAGATIAKLDGKSMV